MSVIYGLLISIGILFMWGFFMEKPKAMSKLLYNMLWYILLGTCSVIGIILLSIAVYNISKV